ncbi:MAG: T9SS type A sorting domain-containing protein [Chitinophagaceae bacterium]|nr:T9SS type A sorting domain-containing protein [Chitinophagaceae bacterium]
MRTYYIFILFLCCSCPLISASQSIQKKVISSSGKVMSGGGASLNYTFGEMAVAKYSNSGMTLAQGFQPYYLIINTPLPVGWLSFDARWKSEHEAILKWRLSNEKNCKGFHIERMQEGEKDFSIVGYVPTQAENGQSDITTDYEYYDNDYQNKKTFYRIRQEDQDGRNSYSETRLVFGNGSTDVNIEIWPVPANTTVHIMVNGLGKNTQVVILDMQGKVIKRLEMLQNNHIELNGLAAGMYIVQVANQPGVSQKIIVQ